MPYRAILLFYVMIAIVLPAVGKKGKAGKEYYDIHLSNDRICKACTWYRLNETEVILENKDGVRGTYRMAEIIGVDTKPLSRKLFYNAVHGVGLPGRIIVPEAFDNEPSLNYP